MGRRYSSLQSVPIPLSEGINLPPEKLPEPQRIEVESGFYLGYQQFPEGRLHVYVGNTRWEPHEKSTSEATSEEAISEQPELYKERLEKLQAKLLQVTSPA